MHSSLHFLSYYRPASERLDRHPHLVTRPAQIMRHLVLVTIFGHSKLTKHQRHLRDREPPAEESCRVIISASLPDEDEEPHPAYVSCSPIAPATALLKPGRERPGVFSG